ncbi:MAG: PIN domain-containing protein [Acidobacteriota bacterium]
MRRLLLDVNVVLDVLLDRRPHVEASGAVWAAIERGQAQGVLAAHAVTTIHYLVRREQGAARARGTIAAILQVFGVAPVDQKVVQGALQLAWHDFEDSATAAAAELAGCHALVTRDPRGFPASPVRVISPEEAAALLSHGSDMDG